MWLLWAVIERTWQPTVERARRLPPELLHQRVDGEWSFIETLRHLVFATDAWVRRAILGDPAPWHPLDLPHDEMPDESGYDLVRRVRNLPPTEGGLVPAIALTAYAHTEDRIKSLAAGFQMHIAKPVHPAELAAAVASLTARSRRSF